MSMRRTADGGLLRVVAILALIVGPPVVFLLTPGGPWVAGASTLAYIGVAVAVRITIWGWPGGQARVALLRLAVSFVVVTSVVVALRVATGGWSE